MKGEGREIRNRDVFGRRAVPRRLGRFRRASVTFGYLRPRKLRATSDDDDAHDERGACTIGGDDGDGDGGENRYAKKRLFPRAALTETPDGDSSVLASAENQRGSLGTSPPRRRISLAIDETRSVPRNSNVNVTLPTRIYFDIASISLSSVDHRLSTMWNPSLRATTLEILPALRASPVIVSIQ